MFPHKPDDGDKYKNRTLYDPESNNPHLGTEPRFSTTKDPQQLEYEKQKTTKITIAAEKLLTKCTKSHLFTNKPKECKDIKTIEDATKKVKNSEIIRKQYLGGFYRSKRRRSRNRKSKKTRKSRKNRRKSKRRSPR